MKRLYLDKFPSRSRLYVKTRMKLKRQTMVVRKPRYEQWWETVTTPKLEEARLGNQVIF